MSKGIGRLNQVGIAKETSRGTAVGTPTYMIAFAELDLDEKDQRVIDEQSYGVVENSVGESIVKQDRKSTRLNSSHIQKSRMPSSA